MTATTGITARLGAAMAAVVCVLTGCDHGTGAAPAARAQGASPSASATAAPAPSAAPLPTPSATPRPSPTPPSSPVPSPAAAPLSASTRYVFPVDGRASYGRTHLKYPATDIIAPCGAAVRSPADGVVLELSRTDTFQAANPDGAAKGGLFVSILGTDGVRYYGSHLTDVVPALTEGSAVAAGTRLGTVGRTGNANNICHLHFGLSPACGRVGDWWLRRGVVSPWSYLDAWRRGEQRSPATDVAVWERANGCRARLPTD